MSLPDPADRPHAGEPPEVAPPAEPAREAPRGFHVSGRRAAVEVGLAVGLLVGAALLVVWLAGAVAGRLTALVPLDVDRALGEQAFAVSSAAKRCENPEPERYVRLVAAPLIEALDETPFEFQFRVVDDDAVNAFALPGGFVTVHVGLLRAAETGDEVAAVLAHELQHALRRHGTRRVLRQLGGGTALYLLFGGTDVAGPAALVASLAGVAYDRDEEREADRLGLDLMQRAGLDPIAMSRFFERLAQESVSLPELLSTHPDPGDRAARAAEAAGGHRPSRTLPAPGKPRCSKP